jgi:F-type H+-transporting ATPase subunit b
MAATEEQVRAMLAEAKANAEALAADIARRAAAEAEETKKRAMHDISTARDQALADIWGKTADLAVSVAGKVLAKSVEPDDHKRLIELAINELPAAPPTNGHAAGAHRA